MKIVIRKVPQAIKDNQCMIITPKQQIFVPERIFTALVKAYFSVPRTERYEAIEQVWLTQYSFNLSKEKWEEIKPLYHQYSE